MKTLITYFSAEGTTKKIADAAAKDLNIDTFEIKPKEPYTSADINWKNPFSRCNKEFAGKKDVPVEGKIINFEEYDLILVGFPIWYGAAPNVINTFLKDYDFNGKKVIAFATSGGSPIGKTKEKLEPYVSNVLSIDAYLIKNAEDLKALIE